MSAITKSVTFTVSLLSLILIIFPASAQLDKLGTDSETGCGGLGIVCNEATEAEVQNTFRNIINTALLLVSFVALGVLIWGGVKYIISVGNENEVEKAKRIILYAIIGLVVIGLAAMITNFVIGLVGEHPADLPAGKPPAPADLP